mgnify:CR=1 FL=1
MSTLKEILKDKAQYQDNLAWQLGNGITVTLGQLRSLSADDQKSITDKEKELLEREGIVNKAQQNTAQLFANMNNALEDIKAGRLDTPVVKQLFGDAKVPGSTGRGSSDPYEALSALEQDSLLGPVVRALKSTHEEAKKAQDAVAQNIQLQRTMATNYLNGVLEDRYDRYVPANKQDKLPLSALIQEAVRLNAFSSDSVPDIRRAYKSLTSGEDAADREKQIRDDERKKVIAEQVSSGQRGTGSDIFVPQPQSFGLDVHNRGGNAPKAFKNLDEAFVAAGKDPDIWNQIDQISH